MKLHIAFLSLMVLTFIWRNSVPLSFRRHAVPWAFSVLIMNAACASFYWGPMRVAYAAVNYASYVIMLDGFDYGQRRENPAWTAFLVFWGYITLSSLYGANKFDAIFYWTNNFLTTFCCGYFTARWVARTENGLGKLLFSMACVSCITMLLYARHGSLAAIDSGSASRAGFDMDALGEDVESNVNYTALVMLTLIPYLLVGLLRSTHSVRSRLTKWMSLISLILAGLILVRTGARNGAVGLLPSLWYFLFSTTNRVKRKKRICLFVLVSVIFLPAVFVVMKGAESIRFLDIGTESQSFYETKEDAITSGRVSMWKNHIESMSILEIIWGRGMRKYDRNQLTNRVSPGNAHSMYMTIFYNSGIVGLFLFLIFLMCALRYGMKMGDRGRMALLFIGTWFFSGAAESWGMTGGTTATVCGFGIGLLSHRVAGNREFEEYNPNLNQVFVGF